MSSLALSFHDVNFHPVALNDGQIWLSSTELAQALGYKNVKSVSNLYNSNKDEFTKSMTQVIESVTSGNYKKKSRIFSLRGCHLIAMFARTNVAKAFRKWVLDVLDKEIGKPVAKTHKSERVPLHDAHALLVAKTKHLNSSEAWKLIHQRFNVQHIDEIPYESIPVAVEYVHHLIALYGRVDQSSQPEHIELIKNLVDAVISQNTMSSSLYRAAHALSSDNAYLGELAFKTNLAVLKLSRAMNIRNRQNQKLISDDLKTANYTCGNQHYGSHWFHPLVESGKLMGALNISGGW